MSILKLTIGFLNLDAVSFAAPGATEKGEPILHVFLTGDPAPIGLKIEADINAVCAELRRRCQPLPIEGLADLGELLAAASAAEQELALFVADHGNCQCSACAFTLPKLRAALGKSSEPVEGEAD